MARSTCISAEARDPIEGGTMEELIPFAKELLSQRPSRGLLKVYLVGSVFALLGTVIGLVETVCHPFTSGDTMDSDVAVTLTTPSARQQNPVAIREDVDAEEKKILKEKLAELAGDAALTITLSKRPTSSQRSMANRLHAS